MRVELAFSRVDSATPGQHNPTLQKAMADKDLTGR